jgi:quinol monooxygenase YgiN
MMLSFAACNNGEEKTNSSSSTDSTSLKADTVAAVPEAPKLAAPFDVVEITHRVKDYDKWRPGFNSDSTARKANGLGELAVCRSIDNPNNVLVALKVSDMEKAKAFAADPRLKDVMEKNGVISKPTMNYFHVIRFKPDSNEKQLVLVTHKVKDFAAWLKVFDGEGSSTRASNGLVDVALSRGIADSNLVHLVFDIKDMAKAKARMKDPALKKLMTDGGVIGTPKFEFYNIAD